MLRVFGDFETYYTEVYSLKLMTPIEYILHPEFEVLGCGVAVDDAPAKMLPLDKVANFLRSLNEPYAFISHNAPFDASILAYHYSIHPPVILDTIGMCRAVFGHELQKFDLGSVMRHFNFGDKLTAIKDMKGVHYIDLEQDRDLLMRWVAYTLNDVNGCRNIFKACAPKFPAQEARIMDTVLRMVTVPQLHLDPNSLFEHFHEVTQHKLHLLKQIGYNKTSLMSDIQFAQILKMHGVSPPMKISPTTGEETYAFAKTDDEFMALLNHPDEMVCMLVEARLGHKTTIEETRTARLIGIAKSTTNSWGNPILPVPLKYSGAHTHRLSGDWKLNLQNLSARKNKRMREAIVAPPKHTIVAIDAKQIEARLTAWLADESELLDAFAHGIDIYSDFAADIYGLRIDQVGRIERFTGKTCILGLGFGMSDERLLFTLTLAAREAGFDVEYTLEQCTAWVRKYRVRFKRIEGLWEVVGNTLKAMANPHVNCEGWKIGPCVVEGQKIKLPSGLYLHYDGLKYINKELRYKRGSSWIKIYGAKATENIVQSLDRQKVFEAALATEERTGYRIVLQVHDENVYCIPDGDVPWLTTVAMEEMCRIPSWGAGLPLAAEAKAGPNYGKLREIN